MWFRIRDAGGLKEALTGARRQKGVSQAELASLLQINRTTLLDLEAGNNSGAMRLIEAFGLLGFDLIAVPRAAAVSVEMSEE